MFDYHLHSCFSFDSKELMENICQKAVEQGISEICFTEHVEFDTADSPWPDFAEREKEIRKCRERFDKKLSVLSGVELGQPQRDIEGTVRLLSEIKPDFVLGSIHSVSGVGSPSKFVFDEHNYHIYFSRYFADLKELAENAPFDILAHITYPFRYVPEEILIKYPIETYYKDFMELFDILVKHDKGIEINTSGFRTSLHDTMPPLQILKWFRDRGGKKLTIGSDGHSAHSAFTDIKRGFEALRESGFTEVCRYKGREAYFSKAD